MTLLIVLVLTAILMVIAIMLIKKTAREKLTRNAPRPNQVNISEVTPPSANPGSIPDKAGTKGDGNSALSSGKQG